MYEEILLVLESHADMASRLRFACSLAGTRSAKLVSLYVRELDFSAIGKLGGRFLNLSAVEEYEEIDRIRATEAGELFREITQAASVDGEWRETGDLSTRHLVDMARYTDLLVFGAHDSPAGMQSIVPDVPAIVLESGCPALIVPESPRPYAPFRRILIAWKPTREAGRAVRDALPFLREAEELVIAAVREEKEGHGDDTVHDIADYLRRHGTNATIARPDIADGDAGTAILSHAATVNADLIVAGFYGHARLSEFVLGGVSRSLLRSSQVPLFLSH